MGIRIGGPAGGGVEVIATPFIRDRLWIQDSDTAEKITEVNPDTKGIIKEYVGPGSSDRYGYGIGGTSTRMYRHSTSLTSEYIREFPPNSPFTTLNAVAQIDSTVRYVGGIFSRLYTMGQNTTTDMWEVNPDTIATINTFSNPVDSGGGRGLGGIKDSNRLYFGTSSTYLIREINPDTGGLLNSAGAPYNNGGIGGVSNRLYFTDSSNGRIYGVNPDTLASLGYVSQGLARDGVGGISPTNYDISVNALIDDVIEPDVRYLIYNGRNFY